MGWFKNLRTVTKLMPGFILVSFLLSGAGYVGISNMAKINGMLGIHSQHDTQGLSAIKAAGIDLMAIPQAIASAILAEKEGLGEASFDDGAHASAGCRTAMLIMIALGVLLGLALGNLVATLIAKGLRLVVQKGEQAA